MRFSILAVGLSISFGRPKLHRPACISTDIHSSFTARERYLFDLRFFRPFVAELSIKKSFSFFPSLIAATSQRGRAPRPAQVSRDGPRYFGATFLPFNALVGRRPRAGLSPLIDAYTRANCFSISARRSRSASSTRCRSSISESTLMFERFTFAIVISD
jgi:hypothetical protein